MCLCNTGWGGVNCTEEVATAITDFFPTSGPISFFLLSLFSTYFFFKKLF